MGIQKSLAAKASKSETERDRATERQRGRDMSGGLKRVVPLLDRVLVERVAPMQKSVGGVILPDSAVSKMNEGTVIAVGPGAKTSEGDVIPMSVKEGDKVLLPEYGGTQVKIDDKEFTLFRDAEILGLLVGWRYCAVGTLEVVGAVQDCKRWL